MNTRKLILIVSFAALSGAGSLALAEGYGSSQSGSDMNSSDTNRSGGTMNRNEPSSSTGSSRSMGTAMDDTAITTKVKAKIATDKRFNNTDISVDTANGVVTLSGTVKSDAAKQAAEDLAKQVQGVASVDNQLTTGNTSTAGTKMKGAAQRTERVASDSWITTKVKSSLLADHTTKGLNIGVKTMNGTVNLTGNVASQTEFDRAVQIAKNIKGVKDVNTSGLQVKTQ